MGRGEEKGEKREKVKKGELKGEEGRGQSPDTRQLVLVRLGV